MYDGWMMVLVVSLMSGWINRWRAFLADGVGPSCSGPNQAAKRKPARTERMATLSGVWRACAPFDPLVSAADDAEAAAEVAWLALPVALVDELPVAEEPLSVVLSLSEPDLVVELLIGSC